MKHFLKSYWDGLRSLIYPQICLSCEQPLVKGEAIACTECLYQIRRTSYHLQKDNPVAQLFYGRIELTFATAYFGFDKGGILQRLIHQLKYKEQKEVGILLGQHAGMGIKQSPHLPPVDFIIPVPLHRKKLKQRGYNQSVYIALGMASVLKAPVDTTSLKRITYASSQTKLSREKRWKNVEDNFEVSKEHNLYGKHVLLVDDVLTTGATIESCCEALKKVNGLHISVTTLARAQ